MFYYVYALYSKKFNKFYIGFSDNLKERLAKHKQGKTFAGNKFKDFKLVYCEICLSKRDAQIREKQLKTGFGRGYLRRRLKNFLMGG